ncbi:MAG: glycosyltransferase, partial [Proteobacteria bacterium]
LVPTGGHNPLEPAALGKPVIMGPHLFNFLEISAMMREAGALREVDDAEGLAEAVRQLFELPRDARRMAEAGLKVMQANQGALERLLDGLDRLIAD